jgi:F-type H+-transporting ATPase subunit epsilon
MADEKPSTRLLILTPDRVALDERVTSIRFQQPDGWQGVLPHHAPYLTRLVDGVMIYRLAGEDRAQAGSPRDADQRYVVLYGGTLQVKSDEVVVLTAAAEPGRSLQELEQRLSERRAQESALAFEALLEFTKVRTALVRALTDRPEAPEAIQ